MIENYQRKFESYYDKTCQRKANFEWRNQVSKEIIRFLFTVLKKTKHHITNGLTKINCKIIYFYAKLLNSRTRDTNSKSIYRYDDENLYYNARFLVISNSNAVDLLIITQLKLKYTLF